MRALAFALLLLPLPAAAQDEGDAGAIEAVIADQLADFNARDLDGAFAHASPMIQGLFGNPGTFGAMVENGYPMVWTNDGGDFLDLREEAGVLRQRVLVRDAEGRGWICDYAMVEGPEGWLIDGVQIVPAPELSA